MQNPGENPQYQYNIDQARKNERNAVRDAENLTKTTNEYLADYIKQTRTAQAGYVGAANRGGQVGMLGNYVSEVDATTSDLSEGYTSEGVHGGEATSAIAGLHDSNEIKIDPLTGKMGGMYQGSAVSLNQSLKNEFNQTKNDAIGNISKMYMSANDYDSAAVMARQMADYESKANQASYMGRILGGALTIGGMVVGSIYGGPLGASAGGAVGGALSQMLMSQIYGR